MSNGTRIPIALILVLAAVGIVIALGLGFGLGFAVRGCAAPAPTRGAGVEPTTKAQVWTCSMHPQIRQPKPGLCPICNMDLIPLTEEMAEGERVFTTSKESRALMDIQTARVERRFVEANVRMVGKVDYDETRVSGITARVPGRLDRLYVDYTGIRVKKGDHMVTLYSPQLLAAQEELIQAVRAYEAGRNSDVALVRESATANLEAVRGKLRLWDLTAEQVAAIEKRGKGSDQVTIYSPMGGIVIEKHVQEGAYVQTGQRIYTIADLSRLWVKLDAYESDLMWLRYGQTVTFTTEAYPGETFAGRIAFIAPVLSEKTRTVKVRVNVDNADGRLKPGMFLRAIARATVAAGGRVIDPALAGKWMCPMHPEIVKETKADCDLCGMPLESVESLGYAPVREAEAERPLVVPASAPLITGERAVVYVELPGGDKPTFEGREVVLGPRAGDWYTVRSGLSEGDLVVTQGAFKIDSALQIQAKPSMMSPEGGAPPPAHHGGHAAPTKPSPVHDMGSDTRAAPTKPSPTRDMGSDMKHGSGTKGDAAPPAAAKSPMAGEKALVPQKTCPIMGGKIDKKLFVDVKGKRIYMCCPGCADAIKKDPAKALATLAKRGEQAEDVPKETAPKLLPQTTCPIMGGKIDKKLFVDVKGKRIYMCCPGCTDAIKKDPDAALNKLRAMGQMAEDAPKAGSK